MRDAVLVLVICAACIAPSTAASGPVSAAVSAAPDNKFENIFVGHYGEILRFPAQYGVEAELRDGMEVVRFHDRKRDPFVMTRSTASDTFLATPQSPTPKEYILENFTPKRLMQLLVVPKTAPGYTSLGEMRKAKVAEMDSARIAYSISDLDNFPKGSFLVYVTAPYKLRQIYAHSDKHFFILTTGDYPEPIGTKLAIGDLGQYPGRLLSDSLEAYLERFRVSAELDPFAIFHQAIFYYIWLGSNVLWLLLAFLPGQGIAFVRLRLVGRATLLFSNGIAAFGWAVVYAAARLDAYRWFNETSAILAVAISMPWICFVGSRALGSQRPWRAFWWTLAVSGPLAILSGQGVLDMYRLPEPMRPEVFLAIVTIFIVLGFVYGICFGCAHSVPKEDGKAGPFPGRVGVLSLLLLCLIPFQFGKASAQTIEVHPSYRGVPVSVRVGDMPDDEAIVAWKVLGVEGRGSLRELRADAENSLKASGQIPEYHRVEVTGVLSTDYDDPEEAKELFSKSLKFSSRNQVRAVSPVRKMLNSVMDVFRDVTGTGKSLNGETTPYIKNLFADLKGASIEEIVAHSAGSEAVYAAILNGVIYPPKRLIIVGVPDENEEKWRLLQQSTGIEVHVVGFETDNMRRRGELLRSVSRFITEKPLPSDSEALTRLWAKRGEACRLGKLEFCNTAPRQQTPTGLVLDLLSAQHNRNGFHYDIHANPPGDDDNIVPQKWTQAVRPIGDHDRAEYYKYLYKTKVLTTTIDDLKKADELLIKEYADREFSAALGTASGLIAEARELAQNGSGRKAPAGGTPATTPLLPGWRLLTAYDILRLVERACANPGSISNAELSGTMWIPDSDLDQYRPGMGDGLTGCARDFWAGIERFRRMNSDSAMSFQAEGMNAVARRLTAQYAQPVAPPPAVVPPSVPDGSPGSSPDRGGDANPLGDRDGRDHSIDLSRAIKLIQRLRSPF